MQIEVKKSSTKLIKSSGFDIVVRSLRALALLVATCLAGVGLVWAHSVGQVQTTKFFAPESVTLLTDRLAAGQPAGFKVGDVVSYIIQFTPIANGATTGVAGYITDYIPPGTEVVGAAIVNRDASGNYFNTAPNFPGGIDFGWGRSVLLQQAMHLFWILPAQVWSAIRSLVPSLV